MVKVITIASAIEPVWEERVETCDPPRFADTHVGERGVARAKPVNAPVEVRKSETVALKEEARA
eukprot:3300766-Lingulodinium_polyedra.AAC.1